MRRKWLVVFRRRRTGVDAFQINDTVPQSTNCGPKLFQCNFSTLRTSVNLVVLALPATSILSWTKTAYEHGLVALDYCTGSTASCRRICADCDMSAHSHVKARARAQTLTCTGRTLC